MEFEGSGLDRKLDTSVHAPKLKKFDFSRLTRFNPDGIHPNDDVLLTMVNEAIERRTNHMNELLQLSLDDDILHRGVLEVEYCYTDPDTNAYLMGSLAWLSPSVPQGTLHTHRSTFETTLEQARAKWDELNKKVDHGF